jgi:hypothetical protein
VAEATANQESLMIEHPMSFQSFGQLWDLTLGLTSRQMSDRFGRCFPIEQN